MSLDTLGLKQVTRSGGVWISAVYQFSLVRPFVNSRLSSRLNYFPAALILFIYAVTSASTDGWGSAGVVAPLVISISMIVGFFVWETRIPPSIAAV